VLIVAPRAVAQLQGDEPQSASAVLLVRTIGIRDLVLGAGTIAAARNSDGDDVRQWIVAGLLSDALDVAAGAAANPLIGRKAALTAASVPTPFVLGDLWALGYLPARRGSPSASEVHDTAHRPSGGTA
jgi:hypothetical protein